MGIDFEKIFKISLNAMRLNRSHPDIPRTKTWFLQLFAMHGLYTIQFSTFVYNIYLNIGAKNHSEACRNCIISVVYCITSSQSIVLSTHKKTITKIMDMMKVDFSKNMTEDEKKIVLRYAMKGREACVQWLMLAIFGGSIFPTKHIIVEVYTYVVDAWKLYPMYPLIYPSPIEELKEYPVVYAVLYLVLAYYVLYATVMYVAFVPLGPIFLLHACGQLEIVKNKILAMHVDRSTKETEANLKEIVRVLQDIYCFVEYVKEAFRVIYELTLKASSIMIPFTLYEVLGSTRRGEFGIEFMSFLIGGILISSAPCYYSDLLMEKGEEVRQAMYFCGWETRYNHSNRKTLTLMLLRAWHPIAIRTVFRTVCLDALADVCRQAYTLLNLMNAAWG